MGLRTRHGTARGTGVGQMVEVCPVDELPAGQPGPARPVACRKGDGKFAPGPGTSAVAAEGGKAKAERRRMTKLLGFVDLPEGHSLEQYHRAAAEFRDEQCARLADTVGGGECGPAPASIATTAALQLMASRYLFDRATELGDAKLFAAASKLANDSRQNLLGAFELAAKEATARAAQNPHESPTHQLIRRIAEAPDGCDP